MGLGTPLLVNVRSQAMRTFVTTVVLLLAAVGSLVVEDTEELAVIVATATVGATFTKMAISTDAPAAIVGFVHVTEAVTVQVHPAGAETETNVVLAGIASAKLRFDAAAGPLLVTVCV